MTPEELEAIKTRVPLRLSDSADVDALLCELKSKDQIIADFTKALDGAHAIQNDLRGELEKAEAARELVSEMLKTAIKDREVMLLQVGELQKVVEGCKDTFVQFCGDGGAVIAHPPKCPFYLKGRQQDCNCNAKNTANDVMLSLRACREILSKAEKPLCEECKKVAASVGPYCRECVHSRKKRNDEVEWVETRCTSLACRGRKKGGAGFAVKVPKGQESGALCNECFSR